MNFLQMGRISLLSVAENIMTCLSCGVILKMSCTSPRMSAERMQACRQPRLCDRLRADHLCSATCDHCSHGCHDYATGRNSMMLYVERTGFRV